MSEHTTLTSYLGALIAERESLNNVDIDAIVEERIFDMRARVKAEVVADVENSKHDADVRIQTITTAISIIASVVEVSEDEENVSEIITDETY
jgi:hypothetical protein